MKFSALLPLLAAPLAAALPAAEAANTMAQRDAPFSFEEWAIAIGKGEPALSVEEALKAAEANGVGSPADKRSLEKRLRCNHLSIGPAYVPDAVSCINYLASSGRMCRVERQSTFCTIGRAQIVGVRGGNSGTFTESWCNDVARAAGHVMDNCWRADNTVQGDHPAWGNGFLNVHIAEPA
ncbi:hypothetical protein B0T11DRAFT_326833 [Plectosphaerella cucumerina]|uniref:Uncharacterized protein n=1 Tax=Plectosphaerella cucumerina TaxID=40658 RepID=A0A8K0TNX3_9PEZI|nr:hypothetical protein B0T11DRAFT_326833 [Plectosphaerella cucumerina]